MIVAFALVKISFVFAFFDFFPFAKIGPEANTENDERSALEDLNWILALEVTAEFWPFVESGLKGSISLIKEPSIRASIHEKFCLIASFTSFNVM